MSFLCTGADASAARLQPPQDSDQRRANIPWTHQWPFPSAGCAQKERSRAGGCCSPVSHRAPPAARGELHIEGSPVFENISGLSRLSIYLWCHALSTWSVKVCVCVSAGDPAGGAAGSQTLCVCSRRTRNRKEPGELLNSYCVRVHNATAVTHLPTMA